MFSRQRNAAIALPLAALCTTLANGLREGVDVSEYLASLREKLLDLVNRHAVVHGDFTLSSGAKSTYYIDGKLLSLMPEGLNYLSRVILEMLEDNVDAIAGLTLGADPIIGGVTALSYEIDRPVVGLIVRKEKSTHGREKRIEGPIKPGMRVVVVEDVVTSGSSSLKAVEALKEAGCQIIKVICIVDRLAGGAECFKKQGIRFDPIFTLKDLRLK